MSRILRRPMFRGGRVSSYGTGIASGLADGGRVNYAGGGQIGGGIIYGKPMADGRYGFADSYLDQLKQHYGMGSNYDFQTDTFPGESKIYKEELKDENLLPGTGEGGTNWFKWLVEQGPEEPDDLYSEVLQEKKEEDASKDFFETKNTDQLSFPRDVEEMGVDVEDSAAVAEKKPGTEFEFTGLEGDDPTAVGDSDLAALVSKYEDLLGMKKAKSEKYSNMALRLAAAKGDTTMEKLQNWFGMEEKAEDETAKIKQTAALLGIKGEQAQKLYETKLTNTTGMFTKKVEEIMSTENVSRSEAINKALGLPGSIDAAVIEFKKRGTGLMSESEFDMLARSQNISKLPNVDITQIADGDYYKPGGKTIVTIKDKTIVDTQTYE